MVTTRRSSYTPPAYIPPPAPAPAAAANPAQTPAQPPVPPQAQPQGISQNLYNQILHTQATQEIAINTTRRTLRALAIENARLRQEEEDDQPTGCLALFATLMLLGNVILCIQRLTSLASSSPVEPVAPVTPTDQRGFIWLLKWLFYAVLFVSFWYLVGDGNYSERRNLIGIIVFSAMHYCAWICITLVQRKWVSVVGCIWNA